jgi:uncharacterized protein involved in exopolysaccharide biosynthesis
MRDGAAAFAVEAEDDIHLLRVANAVLGHRRTLAGVPLAFAVVAVIASFAVRPTFTASTTFLPESPSGASSLSNLSGLASQFGISIGSGDGTEPQFYVRLLRSRQVFDSVLLSRFPSRASITSPADSSTLLDLLGAEGDSLPERLHDGREKLLDLVGIDADRETGVVEVRVDSRDPALAADVANAFVAFLGAFNTTSRQTRARYLREFVEARSQSAAQELEVAENELRLFFERNRTWEQSPQLRIEVDRLQRRVTLRQDILLTLNREFETARIEEVNDQPVISVIDRAQVPQRKSKPRRMLWLFLSLVGGTLVALVHVAVKERTNKQRAADPEEYERFRRLLADAREDFRLLRVRRSVDRE